MTNIAHYIRIFEASPNDDFVGKRITAVTALADAFKKRQTYADFIALGNDIAGVFVPGAHLSDAISTQVAGEIAKESSSFDKNEREQEIQICAALGVLTWLEGIGSSTGNPTRAGIVAMALWSALSFQKSGTDVKLEELRQELIGVGRAQVLGRAETARHRVNVPDAAFSLADGEQAPQIEKKIKDTAIKAIDALRLNAALDREEIDVLWWALGDWSLTLSKRYSDLADDEAILVGSIELAKLLNHLPADAHRHLLMRHVDNTNQKRDLPGFLGKLGDSRGIVGAAYEGDALLRQNPHVFPLLTALGEEDAKPLGAKISRTLDEWGARALLEAGLLHLTTLPELIS